jgi:hypothetical protein
VIAFTRIRRRGPLLRIVILLAPRHRRIGHDPDSGEEDSDSFLHLAGAPAMTRSELHCEFSVSDRKIKNQT